MGQGESKSWPGMVKEGSPEVVMYEVEMAGKCMRKGLQRVSQIGGSVWAKAWWWEEGIVHVGSIRKSVLLDTPYTRVPEGER